MKTRYGFRRVDDVEVFYREAGPSDAPVILLLHGFPTASHMFRDLIPLLADRFRLIAPDLPGFGQTTSPPRGAFEYTFDNLAEVMEGFTVAMSLHRYALYVFDYGAPVGLRMAMRNPERVSAIISQNGNAYVEGFSDQWGPWETYWREPSVANREACRPSLSPDTIRDWQYGTGAEPKLLSPDGYELDIAYMARPGAEEIQLDLILDYRNNVALYPAFQSYFREYRPPLLAVWGRHDPAFLPAGATAYSRDLPNAQVHLLDAGHFALETHAQEVATLMRAFLEPIARQQDGINLLERSTKMPEFFVTPGYGEKLFELLNYSQALRIGNRVEISGQGGWDDDLNIPDTIEDEIAQAFRNVERTLATAGATWEHVVHVNSYHAGGMSPEVNETMTRLYRQYMPGHAPIWTQVGVATLGLPTMRVEIRVTAIVV